MTVDCLGTLPWKIISTFSLEFEFVVEVEVLLQIKLSAFENVLHMSKIK